MTSSLKLKLIAWVIAIGLIALIVFYVRELDIIGNTIGYANLAGKSVVMALFIGAFLGWRFQSKGEEAVDKIRIWTACILLPVFFAPLIGSVTNRGLANSPFESKSFEFIEEKAFASSAYGFIKGETIEPDGCFLFVFYKGKIERLKQEKCQFLESKRGDIISLSVQKGLWGYEVVKER